jgi:hypothetical protein
VFDQMTRIWSSEPTAYLALLVESTMRARNGAFHIWGPHEGGDLHRWARWLLCEAGHIRLRVFETLDPKPCVCGSEVRWALNPLDLATRGFVDDIRHQAGLPFVDWLGES